MGDEQIFWKVVLTEKNRFNWYECILQMGEKIPEEIPYILRGSELTYHELVEKMPDEKIEVVRQFLNYVRELTPENNIAIGNSYGTWYNNVSI